MSMNPWANPFASAEQKQCKKLRRTTRPRSQNSVSEKKKETFIMVDIELDGGAELDKGYTLREKR